MVGHLAVDIGGLADALRSNTEPARAAAVGVVLAVLRPLRPSATVGHTLAVRCLLIDDSEDFLASARRLLEAQGIAVAGCARSSAEALRLVDDLQPDIALVDVELGNDDGIALAAQLVERAPAVRVVLISSHDGAELRELLAGSPAAGFLPKTELGAAALRRFLT